jgi:hypothetical protein
MHPKEAAQTSEALWDHDRPSNLVVSGGLTIKDTKGLLAATSQGPRSPSKIQKAYQQPPPRGRDINPSRPDVLGPMHCRHVLAAACVRVYGCRHSMLWCSPQQSPDVRTDLQGSEPTSSRLQTRMCSPSCYTASISPPATRAGLATPSSALPAPCSRMAAGGRTSSAVEMCTHLCALCVSLSESRP